MSTSCAPAGRIPWIATASLLCGGLAIGSGIVAIVSDYPWLMLTMLASTALAIVLGIAARCLTRSNRPAGLGSTLAGWGTGLGVVGALLALLLPAM